MWNATCPDTLAHSHTTLATREANTVAEEAEKRKKVKYSHLEASDFFVLVAVESLGAFGPEAKFFIRELGRRLADVTSEPLSHHHLIQNIAVAVQRGNTAAVLGSSESVSLSVPFLPYLHIHNNYLSLLCCIIFLCVYFRHL